MGGVMVDFAYIERVLPLYERAAVLTVQLGIEGILLSIVIGLVCALILYEKIPVLRRFVMIYIEVSRNTPLLVQLFFMYYGLPKIGIVLTPEVCGVAGSGFSGRELYGGGVPERSGQCRKYSAGECIQPGNEQDAGDALCYIASGCFNKYSGIFGEYHFPAQRNQCIFSNQPDGFNVYDKRFNWFVL
jgi:His/Glu/Gln/Arg/opine family amino acid ABC transporter permease subunit